MNRLNYFKESPEAFNAMLALSNYANGALDHSLVYLVLTRVSQINGCAYCIDMHTKDAIAHGETAQRLFLLDAWRETKLYTEREQAALAWAESVTKIPNGHVPDDVFEFASKHFTKKELVDLTTLVVVINGWNRFNIAFQTEGGHYKPATK